MRNTIFISMFILIACSGKHQKNDSKNNLDNGKSLNDITQFENDSLISRYKQIINGLTPNYVVFAHNNSYPIEDFPFYDSTRYKSDSIIYYKSQKEFFDQDLNLVKWLLTFKNDSSKTLKWGLAIHPKNSYIKSCSLWFQMTNNVTALNLIENYLDGKGFSCYEYNCSNRDSCRQKKYLEIEQFIATNKNLDNIKLRLQWSKLNHEIVPTKR